MDTHQVCHGLQRNSQSDLHNRTHGVVRSDSVVAADIQQVVRHTDLHQSSRSHTHHSYHTCTHNHSHNQSLSQFHNHSRYHSQSVQSVFLRHQSTLVHLQHCTGTYRVQTANSTEQASWVSDRLHSVDLVSYAQHREHTHSPLKFVTIRELLRDVQRHFSLSDHSQFLDQYHNLFLSRFHNHSQSQDRLQSVRFEQVHTM